MSFIDIKVRGVDKVVRNIHKVRAALDTSSTRGLEKSMDYVRDQSIEFLRANMKNVSEYRPYDSILNIENWENSNVVSKFGEVSCTLTCKSPHAAAVEYGTIGADIRAKNTGGLHFFYEGVEMVRYKVKGQPPKAFFQKGMYMAKHTLPELFKKEALKELSKV